MSRYVFTVFSNYHFYLEFSGIGSHSGSEQQKTNTERVLELHGVDVSEVIGGRYKCTLITLV